MMDEVKSFDRLKKVPGTNFRIPKGPMHRDRKLEALLLAHEKKRRLMETSLHAFARGMWPVLEPGREFIDNWHLHVICEHLEAVTAGQIKRLVINVPFRTSKSTFVSVAWPTWTWLKRPQHQWLIGSYAEKLAIRDSLKMRRILTSPLFQEFWPGRVRLAADQNEKRRFQNTDNGYRIAFGMTGGVMGDGGDTLVIDDPHDREGANSEVQRETALTTYDEALITRLNDPDTSPIVIIMQRLHEKDLAGHVLEEKGWEHLMLPMEYEQDRHCTTSIGFSDPRKTEGELLWPARFSRRTVDALKVRLGEYGASGQLQQRPSPAGGGVLKVEHFQLWPKGKPLPRFEFILQSYDTAFTDRTEGDPCACTVWGVFTMMFGDVAVKKAMLLDAWQEHLGYPALKAKVMKDWRAEYGGDDADPMNKPRRPDLILVEEKGSGISLLQDLRLANVPATGYNPGHMDKTARAHLSAPLLEADAFYLIESNRSRTEANNGKVAVVKWAQWLPTQMAQFPNGEHDDGVDTFTQATIYLQRAGFLELPVVPDDPVIEHDYHEARKRLYNPYAQ